MPEKKYDIKETLEILDFAIGVLNDANAAKENGISVFEAAQIAIGNAPAAYRAYLDGEISIEEIKDLDKDEAKVLLNKSMELSRAVMAFFSKAAA